MDTEKILSELRAERDRIDRAISAMEALSPGDSRESSGTPSSTGKRAPGRPSSTAQSQPRKRKLSAAARKRISEAAKKRWAERKRTA